ncbi:MAG: hypothetical protein PHX98_02695 [Candidatus Moranbacteria bacterium]|nr:hypothetical protein [Candidatus Moranbacteria bacterium]
MAKKRNPKGMKDFICKGIFCEKNIKRDSLIIAVVVIAAASLVGATKYGYFKKNLEQRQERARADMIVKSHINDEFQNNSRNKINSIQSRIDSGIWKDYQTQLYGFKIKYPQDWNKPIAGIPVGDSGAEYRYGFRKAGDDDDKYIGFDVAVYDINKTKELTSTGEYPKLKDGITAETEGCETIEGHLIETGEYPAEFIYIPYDDDCFQPVLFFSVTQGQYIYNIVPVVRAGAEASGDPMVEVSDNLPEFFEAISFFENIEIVRPKPKPVPKITAPKPVSYKKDSLGRLVCAKDNDKPSKSKQNKGKHLDMECCLDPDEYPNPHCYYPPEKYGKYLR